MLGVAAARAPAFAILALTAHCVSTPPATPRSPLAVIESGRRVVVSASGKSEAVVQAVAELRDALGRDQVMVDAATVGLQPLDGDILLNVTIVEYGYQESVSTETGPAGAGQSSGGPVVSLGSPYVTKVEPQATVRIAFELTQRDGAVLGTREYPASVVGTKFKATDRPAPDPADLLNAAIRSSVKHFVADLRQR